MKKILSLLLMIVLIITGCSSKEVVEYSKNNTLAEDGIVSKELLEAIKNADDIAIFNGSSNDISYQWLYKSKDIDTLEDENLSLTFSNTQVKQVKDNLKTDNVLEFSFNTNKDIANKPTLSFYLPEKWENEKIVIYDLDKEQVLNVADVDNTTNTIVTYQPSTFNGLLYIVGLDKNSKVDLEKADGGKTALKNSEKEESKSEESNSSSHQNDSSNKQSLSDAQNNNSNDSNNKPASGNNSNKQEENTVTLSISVKTLLKNKDMLDKNKQNLVPANGMLMSTTTITFTDGETVFDVLKRATQQAKLQMEFSVVPAYDSAYIEGIGNLYEFDAGSLSGWVYKVNGWSPNYGASKYVLKDGDKIEWHYTVDLGKDVGAHVQG